MALNKPVLLENAVIPTAEALTQVLSIPNEVDFATLQLNVANDSDADFTIRVAISAASTPNGVLRKDFIECGDTVKKRGRYTNFGIAVPGGRSVYVLVSSGNAIVRATALAQVSN